MTVKVWEFLKIVIRLVATKTSLATVTIIVSSNHNNNSRVTGQVGRAFLKSLLFCFE